MDFGTFMVLQPGPPPYGRERIPQVWHEALEQTILSEELGFDSVWAAEHHFLGDYSSSSAPEVFLTWVAAQTRRLRIAHGVTLVPKEFNHAWRIAERVAALDVVSGGRVEFGAGRSITMQELHGFGIDPAASRGMQLEALDMLPRMWTQDTFSWQGEYYDLPERSLALRPVQQPYPPMWLACSQPASFRLAGERGLGVLSFGFGQPGLLEKSIAGYREGLATAAPVGGLVNDRLACAPLFFCAETDREALRIAAPHVEFFLSHSLGFITQWADTEIRDYDFFQEMLSAAPGEPEPVDIPGLTPQETQLATLVRGGTFCIGSPDTCAEFVRRYVDAGFDQTILLAQFGALTDEQVKGSLRLFAEEVMPRFRTS